MEQVRSGPGLEQLEDFLRETEQKPWPERKRRLFRRYLDSLRGLLADGQELDRWALDQWREELRATGLSESSVEKYVTDVNHFLRWAGYEALCYRQGRPAKLEGQRFGRLLVLERAEDERRADRSARWLCRCDCGKEVVVASNRLLGGSVVSCGCLRTEQLMENNAYVDGTCLRQVLSDRIRADNTSGHPGVYCKNGKWMARIQYKGKIYSLGSYTRKEDAISARKHAEEWVREDAVQLLASMEDAVQFA